MTSEEARERFGDALDGALDDAARADFDAAIARDPALREAWEGYARLVRETREVWADEGDRGGGRDGLDRDGVGRAGVGRDGAANPEGAGPDLLRGVQAKLRARSRGRFYRDRFAESGGARGGPATLLFAMAVVLVAALALVLLLDVVQVALPAAP